MHRPSLPLAVAALVLAAGCNSSLPLVHKPASSPTGVLAAPLDPTRVVVAGIPAELVGKVRLMGDQGGSLIANNAGNIISNNASGLTSRARYQLAQTGTPETLLSDARIDVLDASGHVLLDHTNQPIGATSDAQGNYQLNATLPDQDVVLRVKLFPNGGGPAGQLYCLRPRAGTSARQTLDIDTAATLSARYVLDVFVKGQQAVSDRLPTADAQTLHDAYEAARLATPPQLASYQPADTLAAARSLAATSAAVTAELSRIQSLLLAGQANLGTGRLATQVALAAPSSVVGDGQGTLYVAEYPTGRVRAIAPDGTIRVFAGQQIGSLASASALVRLPDGSLLVADPLANAVRRIALDGTVSPFAGGGTGAPGGPATQLGLNRPTSLAVTPDGSVYVGEVSQSDTPSRLILVDTKGQSQLVTPPASSWSKPAISSLAVAADGTLDLLDSGDQSLQRRAPGGSWTATALPDFLGSLSRLALDAQGTLYLANSEDGTLQTLGADGVPKAFGGVAGGSTADHTPIAQAQLDQPTGMWAAADGTLYLTEAGSGLLRAIAPTTGHPVSTVAGLSGSTQVGNATTISVGTPLGVALDANNDLVISEATSNVITRLVNGTLSLLAGSKRGPVVVPATALTATFDGPGALAFDGQLLYVLDTQNRFLRKIDLGDPTHPVTTVGGAGFVSAGPEPAPSVPADKVDLSAAFGLAIGPDHLPYVSDNKSHRIWRFHLDGTAEVVAGLNSPAAGGFAGDGGPAQASQLMLPSGLAFDAHGNLFVADTGNAVIREITQLGAGEIPQIKTFAGTPIAQIAAQLVGGALPGDEGGPASQAFLYGTGPLAFDAKGGLIEAEIGTAEVALLLPAFAPLIGTQIPRVGVRIRRITSDGTIHTLAGDGTQVMNDPDNDDILSQPTALQVDAHNRLVIGDVGTNQVRLLPLP